MSEAAVAGPEISPEISRFDAENATALTADFLKRLGYKGSWLPMKVAIDGELYVVEMMLQKLTAKVQINSQTKEIKEYEFQKSENEQSGLFSKNKIMFLITTVSLALMVTKLIGVF
jgi:aldehyde:ferredoxin oxidoreductase